MKQRLQWYLDRLGQMPAEEVRHRIKEAARRLRDRGGTIARIAQTLPQRVVESRLPTWPFNPDLLREAFAEDEKQRLRERVARLLNGELNLLGRSWPRDARRSWAIDPESGRPWPWKRFCFSIQHRHGMGPGDVKFVWELNRLHHLQTLALGAFLLDDGQAGRVCLEDLRHWIAHNPPYQGLGYASGIEVASRLISMLVVLGLSKTEALSREFAKSVWQSLSAHGTWLYRYPSLYSSANNHLIAEACGLFVLGSLAPALPEAGRWRHFGKQTLEREAVLQIHGDGVGGEQSPSYLAYVLEWLLAARTVALATGQAFSAAFDSRLAAAACFLVSIMDRSGHHPRIGDEDEAVVFGCDLGEERNHVMSVCGAAAAALKLPQCLHPRYRGDLRALLLGLSQPGESEYRARSVCYREGGYSVIHREEGSREILTVFDHGPLGYAFTAGHGHADALSIWLHIDGVPILVDAGTYRYNADGGWRRYCRGTAAHNTATIEQCSQSTPAGAFLWGRRARARLEHADIDEERGTVTASHDGYASRFGVIHRRTVEVFGLDLIRVVDCLEGGGSHGLSIAFHFTPKAVVHEQQGCSWLVTIGGRPVLRLKKIGNGLVGKVERQARRPGPGAVSTAYNLLVPSPVLLFEGRVFLPQEWSFELQILRES